MHGCSDAPVITYFFTSTQESVFAKILGHVHLDGVITGTARVHALAWESMFNDFLKKNADKENIPFVSFDSEHDYLQYVDGKPMDVWDAP